MTSGSRVFFYEFLPMTSIEKNETFFPENLLCRVDGTMLLFTTERVLFAKWLLFTRRKIYFRVLLYNSGSSWIFRKKNRFVWAVISFVYRKLVSNIRSKRFCKKNLISQSMKFVSHLVSLNYCFFLPIINGHLTNIIIFFFQNIIYNNIRNTWTLIDGYRWLDILYLYKNLIQYI